MTEQELAAWKEMATGSGFAVETVMSLDEESEKASAAEMAWLMAEVWAMSSVVHWGVALVSLMGKTSAAEMALLMA